MSNFEFLNKKWPTLAKLGVQAENYLHTDSNASMLKMRMFGEQIIDLVLAGLNIEVDRFATQDDKIKLLRNAKINQSIPDLFDIISFMIFIASFENPISSFVLKKLSLFKILRTVFSP